MNKICLYDFYNHDKFMKSVKEGGKIIDNTDFGKFRRERIKASKKYKLGDIVKLNGRVYNGLITKIEDGYLYLQPISKKSNRKINKYGIVLINAMHIETGIEK